MTDTPLKPEAETLLIEKYKDNYHIVLSYKELEKLYAYLNKKILYKRFERKLFKVVRKVIEKLGG